MAKKKSKRITIHLKNKIRKKVAEAHKKARKAARLNPKKQSRKDPGVPNMFPFKEELLTQIENHKARLEQEKEEEKAARHQARLERAKEVIDKEREKLERRDQPSKWDLSVSA